MSSTSTRPPPDAVASGVAQESLLQGAVDRDLDPGRQSRRRPARPLINHLSAGPHVQTCSTMLLQQHGDRPEPRGMGRRGARPSSRSTPNTVRISRRPSAAVDLRTSNRSRTATSMSTNSTTAASACSAINESRWARTSCISRAGNPRPLHATPPVARPRAEQPRERAPPARSNCPNATATPTCHHRQHDHLNRRPRSNRRRDHHRQRDHRTRGNNAVWRQHPSTIPTNSSKTTKLAAAHWPLDSAAPVPHERHNHPSQSDRARSRQHQNPGRRDTTTPKPSAPTSNYATITPRYARRGGVQLDRRSGPAATGDGRPGGAVMTITGWVVPTPWPAQSRAPFPCLRA